jgi:isopentenyl phosphate kinase
MTPAPSPVTLVKWGGSLLTDKRQPATLRPEVLRRLAGELAEARGARPGALVLGHGSGSFGHAAAVAHRLDRGLPEPSRRTAVGRVQAKAAELHRHVLGALLDAGVPAYSIAPSSTGWDRGGTGHLELEPLALALAAGLVPVVYGDVVMAAGPEVRIWSTETVFTALADHLPAHGWTVDRCLWLGETAGVLDAAGAPLALLRRGDPALRAVGTAAGLDVTGGMAHRVDAALSLARRGIPSWIGDGTVPGHLTGALLGRAVPGTRVEAAASTG